MVVGLCMFPHTVDTPIDPRTEVCLDFVLLLIRSISSVWKGIERFFVGLLAPQHLCCLIVKSASRCRLGIA